jgi:hypothetical protein
MGMVQKNAVQIADYRKRNGMIASVGQFMSLTSTTRYVGRIIIPPFAATVSYLELKIFRCMVARL